MHLWKTLPHRKVPTLPSQLSPQPTQPLLVRPSGPDGFDAELRAFATEGFDFTVAPSLRALVSGGQRTGEPDQP